MRHQLREWQSISSGLTTQCMKANTHTRPPMQTTHTLLPGQLNRGRPCVFSFLCTGSTQLLVKPFPLISPILPRTGLAGIAATVPPPSALAGIPLIGSNLSLPALSTTAMTSRFNSSIPPIQPTASQTTPISIAAAPYPNTPQGPPIIVSPNDPPIPNKLAQRVWKGEYIELSEFLPETLGAGDSDSQGTSSGTRNRKVSSISQWIQCFNTYTSIVALKQPSRITDLLAYSSLIVQAHRKYSGDNWQVYDRNFRRQAAARQLLSWAHIDPSLWTMAFANATTNQHCQGCLSLDHPTCECPDRGSDSSVPICRRWNWMECSQSSCRYRHICSGCLSPHHKECRCPLGHKKGPSRPQPYPSFRQRSPPRPTRKDYPPDRVPFRSYRGRDPR